MYVRSPISTSSITKGKLYKVRKLNGDLAIIISDEGEILHLYLPRCAHLGGGTWEIVPADQLTKEKKETSMTAKRTPEEITYDATLEALNLKKGDIVTITGEWPSYHLGWDNSWVEEMNEFLGGHYTVENIIPGRKGVKLFWKESSSIYLFPPYVLKKLADAPKKPEPSDIDNSLKDYFTSQAQTLKELKSSVKDLSVMYAAGLPYRHTEDAPTTEPELMASDATLKDYFAAQALTELAYDYSNPEEVATHCYTLAGAMMAEKERRRKKA